MNINYSKEKIGINNLPFQPDMIISIYYRYIISREVINIVNGKIFNLHPSLLPEYKGTSSITWAMINQEQELGYTYHYINEKIDEGDIILQKKLPIYDWETQQSLYYSVMFEAMNDFKNVFDLVKKGYEGEKQPKGGQYYPRKVPFDGKIDPNWSEEKIESFIRAMTFPPLPSASFKDKEVLSFKDYEKIRDEN